MSPDPAPTPSGPGSLAGRIGSWIGVISAAVTVVLTGVNAYWSNRISRIETELQREQIRIQRELEEQRIQLDAGRERLERFTFAQALLEDLLDDQEPARSLKINLVNLALTEEESRDLWEGLRASQDEQVRTLGTTAVESALARLVQQMDAPTRDERVRTVQRLIDEYAASPQAVEQALLMLEMPRVATLSPSGRINVMVYLGRTEPGAWTPETLGRVEAALAAMRARARSGEAAIGDQTRAVLQELEAHLEEVRGAVGGSGGDG